MKFLQLEILNLASLDKQGGEVINFEEGALGESTIFSIVGSDGKWQVYPTRCYLPCPLQPRPSLPQEERRQEPEHRDFRSCRCQRKQPSGTYRQ